MSTMIDAGAAMESGTHSSTVAQFPTQSHRIKRMGGRPLVFDGSELAMAMSFSSKIPYWYEINLYRTKEQRFVVVLRQFFVSDKEEDCVHGWEFSNLDEAIDMLLQYDAGQDVEMGLGIDPNTALPAELSAYAMDLRAQAQDRRQHFSSLVGEFLYELESGQ